MHSKNKKYQPSQTVRTPRRKKNSGRAVLVLLIFLLAVSGLYLIFEQDYWRWLQDRASERLIDSFEYGDGTIVIGVDEYVVSGEYYDYYYEMTETVAETVPATEPTESAVPGETGAAAPSPAPTAAPETIVITAIGRIRIPDISVNMPIAEGATRFTLRVAIGHYTNSPLPGEPGVAIFLGHRSYTYGRHFNRMDEVNIGDKIIVENKTRRYTYEVDQIDIVEPAALLNEFNNPTQEPRIMLVTCTPVRVASHRILVKGALISTEQIG